MLTIQLVVAAEEKYTAGDVILKICQGQKKVTLPKAKDMARNLLTRALAEYRQIDTHTDRTHVYCDEQVEDALEEMHGFILQWYGAHKTLRRPGHAMSDTLYKMVAEGKEKAYNLAFNRAENLMRETQYDVEQLVARMKRFRGVIKVCPFCFGDLLNQAEEE